MNTVGDPASSYPVSEDLHLTLGKHTPLVIRVSQHLYPIIDVSVFIGTVVTSLYHEAAKDDPLHQMLPDRVIVKMFDRRFAYAYRAHLGCSLWNENLEKEFKHAMSNDVVNHFFKDYLGRSPGIPNASIPQPLKEAVVSAIMTERFIQELDTFNKSPGLHDRYLGIVTREIHNVRRENFSNMLFPFCISQGLILTYPRRAVDAQCMLCFPPGWTIDEKHRGYINEMTTGRRFYTVVPSPRLKHGYRIMAQERVPNPLRELLHEPPRVANTGRNAEFGSLRMYRKTVFRRMKAGPKGSGGALLEPEWWEPLVQSGRLREVEIDEKEPIPGLQTYTMFDMDGNKKPNDDVNEASGSTTQSPQ